MERISHVFMLALVVSSLAACVNTANNFNGRPAWIDTPGHGVSASAGMHVRGRVAQEDLAVLRAREEYAKRFGISIQSEQTAVTTVSNDNSSTIASKTMREEVNQSGIKTVVKEKWRDPGTDVLWVWVVPTDK